MSSRFVSLLVAIAVVVAGCLPGYQVTEGNEQKQITGRLGGETQHKEFLNQCAWLLSADGRRTYLLFMADLEVRPDPIRLIDEAGRKIATVGDVVTAVGPSSAIGDNGCALQKDTFVVDTLIGPGGTWHDPTVDPVGAS